MTNGPQRAIGSRSGRAAASRNRPPCGTGGGLDQVALAEDHQRGRARAGLPGPEADLALIDVREHRVAQRHRLPERRAGGQGDVHELRRDGQSLDGADEPSVAALAGDHADARAGVDLGLGQPIGAQLAILRPAHLVARRQVEPQLQPGDAFGAHLRHLLVQDAAARAHPLDVAGPDRPAVPERIAVGDLAVADERHRLDAAVRVIGEARFVVGGLGRLEVIEQEKGIEVVEAARAEAAPQVHARPLDDRLRRDDLRHWARGLAHGVSFPSKTGRLLAPGLADRAIPVGEVEDLPDRQQVLVLEIPHLRPRVSASTPAPPGRSRGWDPARGPAPSGSPRPWPRCT